MLTKKYIHLITFEFITLREIHFTCREHTVSHRNNELWSSDTMIHALLEQLQRNTLQIHLRTHNTTLCKDR